MKKSLKIKAAFLLMVFSMNTLVGFACTVGLDKIIKGSGHHKEEMAEPVVHIHADGKKHIHHEEPKKVNPPPVQSNTTESENNCCTFEVIKYEQIDKSLPGDVKLNSVFFTTFISAFYNIEVLYTSYISTSIRYFVRSYHPPIPSIRIAIQSFQI